MHSYELAVPFVAGLIGLPTINAAAPNIAALGSALILSDNDLAGNLTIKTTGALLLSSSTFSAAEERCVSANEQLWSPTHSNYSFGLDNAFAYQAYLNGNETLRYWISSPSNNSELCNTIATDGTISQKPCDSTLSALCTNSGPILSANQSSPIPALQVTVQFGKQSITGFRDFYAFQFRGVRFSSQPKRFTFSSLYEGEGEVDATKYGPGCLQGLDARWPELSEDCLFLNIWTPFLPSKDTPKKKLKAVMVWLYGGGSVAGTGSDYEKEGGNPASRGDVVVVTFNYRVGNLGFLAFNDGVHNGNYGISDMVTALRWVQKNIANFGGDPDRVTIWGESAGATNSRTLLGYSCGGRLDPRSDSAEFVGRSYVRSWSHAIRPTVHRESGCANATDEVACLSSYDALKWATEPGRTQAHFPVRDEVLIFTRALPLSGPLAHKHRIPVMIGKNRDELSYLITTPTTNFTATMALLSSFSNVSLTHLSNSSFSPERLPTWPSLSEAQKEAAVFNATNRVATRLFFTCLTHAFAYSATKNNVFTAVYEFQFNRTYQTPRFGDAARPICGRDVDNPDVEEYFKCHAGEVPYTFGNIVQQGWPDRDGTDTKFARVVVDWWSGFARTGGMQVEEGWLEARGFQESRQNMEEAGRWVGDGSGYMRLQWGGVGMVGREVDEEGCREMGLGTEFYEGYDYAYRDYFTDPDCPIHRFRASCLRSTVAMTAASMAAAAASASTSMASASASMAAASASMTTFSVITPTRSMTTLFGTTFFLTTLPVTKARARNPRVFVLVFFDVDTITWGVGWPDWWPFRVRVWVRVRVRGCGRGRGRGRGCGRGRALSIETSA
ncbi:alpha/beta-hydrolase [Karstenula rhodostoma CBS 690.94]|uniref:Alpha/beta-hydrolase n=1 Tax=Karstenula rhodostoma CBS 690.94 TaxID=1392251 RepID=A0A9P4PRQ0_9PLEO|nr:alpha/beta-hydrolase [Karstenula rhodostoma CBS 690.94]